MANQVINQVRPVLLCQPNVDHEMSIFVHKNAFTTTGLKNCKHYSPLKYAMEPTYTAATKKCRAIGCLPRDIQALLEKPVPRPSKTQILQLSVFSFIINSVKHGENA